MGINLKWFNPSAAGPETIDPEYVDPSTLDPNDPVQQQQMFRHGTQTIKPGPRGWKTIPWKDLATYFGGSIAAAYAAGYLPEGAEEPITSAAPEAGGATEALGPTMSAGAAPGTIVAGTPGAAADTVLGADTAAGAAGTGGTVAGLSKAIGPALSAMSAGRAKGRIDQNTANLDRDKLLEQEAVANANQGNTAADIDLNQRKFAQTAGQQNLANALRGGLLQGTQDINFSGLSDNITKHMPTVTGGLRPSALTGKDAIGSDLQRQALLNLMNPDQASAGPMSALNVAQGLKAPKPNIQFPGLTPQPTPGGLDTFLNYAGPAATLIGGYFGR